MVSTKVATSKTIAARRKNIKYKFREMSKIAASQRGKGNSRDGPFDTHEPIILGRRVVLRSQITVSVKLFVALHKLYKEDSVRATDVLAANMSGERGEPTLSFNVALRCAIQELWDE